MHAPIGRCRTKAPTWTCAAPSRPGRGLKAPAPTRGTHRRRAPTPRFDPKCTKGRWSSSPAALQPAQALWGHTCCPPCFARSDHEGEVIAIHTGETQHTGAPVFRSNSRFSSPVDALLRRYTWMYICGYIEPVLSYSRCGQRLRVAFNYLHTDLCTLVKGCSITGTSFHGAGASIVAVQPAAVQ